jgi:cytochrome bd-type quinol oxidase subunit 1
MNYPSWDVPHIGSGWVIGIIAIIHIMFSHFAVGGGLYLPMAERKALREGRNDWLEVIHSHAKFFLILTGVFGVATGVGIWFAIGLVNPEATSTLIHNFVFGWAIEWTFFTVELTTAAVYYYTWKRIPDALHLKVGYVYAGFSFLTLVIINGILTFMLTPGEAWLSVAGTGHEASKFWYAFFNPTYWPSLFLRTLTCVSLAGIWALVTASRIDGYTHPQLKKRVIQFSARWLVPAFFLLPAFLLWYLYMVPVEQRGLLNLGIATIGQGVFTQVTRATLITFMTSATIGGVVYFMADRNSRDFSFGHACAVLFLALAATGSTEYAREMLRKPYVVGRHMYSNGVRVKGDVERFNRDGYLAKSPWVSDAERAAWASNSTDPKMTLARGEMMMRGQCMACHTVNGYRSLRTLLNGRDREAVGNILKMLHEHKDDSPYKAYMPQLVGTQQEISALGDYLAALVATPKDAKEPVKVAAAKN